MFCFCCIRIKQTKSFIDNENVDTEQEVTFKDNVCSLGRFPGHFSLFRLFFLGFQRWEKNFNLFKENFWFFFSEQGWFYFPRLTVLTLFSYITYTCFNKSVHFLYQNFFIFLDFYQFSQMGGKNFFFLEKVWINKKVRFLFPSVKKPKLDYENLQIWFKKKKKFKLLNLKFPGESFGYFYQNKNVYFSIRKNFFEFVQWRKGLKQRLKKKVPGKTWFLWSNSK